MLAMDYVIWFAKTGVCCFHYDHCAEQQEQKHQSTNFRQESTDTAGEIADDAKSRKTKRTEQRVKPSDSRRNRFQPCTPCSEN